MQNAKKNFWYNKHKHFQNKLQIVGRWKILS